MIKSKGMVLTTCFFIMVTCSMIYSIQAPFYLAEAHRKGVSTSVAGSVFSIYQISAFIASFLNASVISRLGIKFTLLIGSFVLGISAILFGCLSQVKIASLFISYSLVLRVLEAAGSIAVDGSIITILSNSYPELALSMMSWAEVAIGIGQITGPLIGGVLYDIGGFILPFLVIGSLMIVSLFPLWFINPNQISSQSNNTDFSLAFLILKLPKVWHCIAINIILQASTPSIFQTTLEPHIRKFNLTGKSTGFVFLLQGLGYGAFCPLWSLLCDKGISTYGLMSAGALLEIIGLSLVGPLPWLPVKPNIWIVNIGVFICGAGIGLLGIPSMAHMKQGCRDRGYSDDIYLQGILSMIWLGSCSLGGFFGPIICGVLFDTVGFYVEILVYIIIYIMIMILLIILVCTDNSYIEHDDPELVFLQSAVHLP